MRDFTVIIPTWNMGPFLEGLFNSITSTPFAEVIEEVIFVCEKSTDESELVIQRLQQRQGEQLPRVTIIQPEERRGLFVARYLGAQSAKTEKIFFIDSRIVLPPTSGKALKELGKKYPAMCANVDIDINKNIYCLYWQRSHETIFRKTYQANLGVNTVTAENYDEFRIGGTCFFCSREPFVRLSEKYLKSPLLSDDTMLLKDLVAEEPITVHPDFRIWWEPRNQLKAFLKHLYIRGPGFAEYHVFEKRGWLFYAIAMAVILGVLDVVFFCFKPILAIAMVGLGLFVIAISTALFARSVREFFLLAPLHIGVILSYGIGALRGIWVIWRKRRRGDKLTHLSLQSGRDTCSFKKS